jgi:hypothetical protein
VWVKIRNDIPEIAKFILAIQDNVIGATYGSIQSVRIPDTAYIQCPPEDEHVMLETYRGS